MTSETKIVENILIKERGRLFNFIKKYVPLKEDAEDILQDVFYQFIAGFDDIVMMDKVTAWLFKSVRNKIIDRSRKKKPDSFSKLITTGEENEDEDEIIFDFIPSFNYSPEDLFLSDEFNDELNKALDSLPPEQKDIFIMNEMEGFSFKEISEITGLNQNTLLSRKRYAVNQLRKKLSKYFNKQEIQ